MTCGGFENNEYLRRDNSFPKIMFFSGNSGNTRDGIKMVQKVGAATRHIWAVSVMEGQRFDDSLSSVERLLREWTVSTNEEQLKQKQRSANKARKGVTKM